MDVELLNEAFHSFTTASRSLETYYEALQEKVRHLTAELETKNKQLNAALADAEKSKDYLNAILYNLEEAIIVVDPYDKITMLNKSAEDLLCLQPQDAAGKEFSTLDFSITGEEAETFLSVKGKKYNIILSRSLVVDSEGLSRGSVILIKDITRLRELELHHERNQRLIAMGEMAATIVHEIKNPLCSIELFASMLEKDLADTRHKELAIGISTGISNLNNIMTNMILFAKPHKPALKAISLDGVLEESMSMCMPFADSGDVKISKTVFASEISGDRELLKQVFMNIIINAIHSMPCGGRVDVAMRKAEGFVIVDIKDNGVGIRHGIIEKIFDPFFSTKDNGTGLGLAIAAKIMQAHGGYIEVDSEENEGSDFGLYFPEGPEGPAVDSPQGLQK